MKDTHHHAKYKKWESHFQELLDFRKLYPNSWPTRSNSFGKQVNWIMVIRLYYKEGKLPQDWIDRFNAIGFPFDKKSGWVDRHYETIQEVVKIISATNEPLKSNKPEYKNLYAWYHLQKKSFLKELEKDKPNYKKVREILLDYKESSYAWKKTYDKLLEFYNLNKRFPSIEENRYLYWWIVSERTSLKKRERSQKQIRLLSEIGVFKIDTPRWILNWDDKYKIFKEFVNKNNDFPKQKSKNKTEHLLYNWAQQQRKQLYLRDLNKEHSLSEEQLKKLKEINFYYCLGPNYQNRIYL